MKTSNWHLVKKNNKVEIIYIDPEHPVIPDGIDPNSMMPLGEVTKVIKESSSKIPRTKKGEVMLCIAQLLSDVLTYSISGNGDRVTFRCDTTRYSVDVILIGQTLKVGGLGICFDLCDPECFDDVKKYILNEYLCCLNRHIIEILARDNDTATRIVINEADKLTDRRIVIDQNAYVTTQERADETNIKNITEHHAGYMRIFKMILNKLNGPMFKVSDKLGMIIQGPYGACFKLYNTGNSCYFGGSTWSFRGLFEIDATNTIPYFDQRIFGNKTKEIRELVVPIIEKYKTKHEERPPWEKYKPAEETDAAKAASHEAWDRATKEFEARHIKVCLEHLNEIIKVLDEKGYFDIRQLADY